MGIKVWFHVPMAAWFYTFSVSFLFCDPTLTERFVDFIYIMSLLQRSITLLSSRVVMDGSFFCINIQIYQKRMEREKQRWAAILISFVTGLGWQRTENTYWSWFCSCIHLSYVSVRWILSCYYGMTVIINSYLLVYMCLHVNHLTVEAIVHQFATLVRGGGEYSFVYTVLKAWH